GRLVMVSPVSGIYAKVRQKFHLSPLFKFPEPALCRLRPSKQRAKRVPPSSPIFTPVSPLAATPLGVLWPQAHTSNYSVR
ncbi:hypothetical protein, partial [Sinorhizobium meliloti]|uniref:hypothetical protein n=1 Tax=Rhizobium meliloti TaxID=382 RepID=UPI001AEC75A4